MAAVSARYRHTIMSSVKSNREQHQNYKPEITATIEEGQMIKRFRGKWITDLRRGERCGVVDI